MQDGIKKFITITFRAFDKECKETFYDTEDEEFCKLIVWRNFCNTAVLLSIEKGEVKIKYEVISVLKNNSIELSKLKYDPIPEYERLLKLKKEGKQ